MTLRNRHYLLLDVVLFALTPAIALGLRVEPASFSPYARGLVWFSVTALFVKIFGSLFSASIAATGGTPASTR